MTKSLTVLNRKWHGDGTLDLNFPDRWEVIECLMNGHSSPELTPDQIEIAFRNPAGGPGLSILARGKHKVVIIFDDITRATPVSLILPHVLSELREAGIPDNAIRFICALGCHGAHSYQDFEKKLGGEILDRFPVYNHNIYENCTYIGETSQGTRLCVNSEVMSCDLKIGIGSIVAHPQTGFGGGGKIILPGVASLDSIEQYHSLEYKARKEGRSDTVGMGNYIDNPLARDFMEAATVAGLDFKIDFALNGSDRPCAVFCGKPEFEYNQALKYAVPHYASKPVPATDIVVVNTYSKGSESNIGMIHGILMLMEKGGDFLLIMDCPAGQVVHYLNGSFGETSKGRQFQAINFNIPWIKRMIILCPQFEQSQADQLAIPGTIWVKSWAEGLDCLARDYPGYARVAVVPDATLQYLSNLSLTL